MCSVRRLLAVLATAALLAPAGAAAAPQLVPVGSFDNPMYVTAPPGDRSRLFVVERAGPCAWWPTARGSPARSSI